MKLTKNWYEEHRKELLSVYKKRYVINDVLDYLANEYQTYPDEKYVREKINAWTGKKK